jgi:KipI family sensor histidine kinase inhibitor
MPPLSGHEAMDYEAIAEDALLLRFGDIIDVGINARVHAATRRLREKWPSLECVPAYASVLVRFDPRQWVDEAAQTPHEHLYEVLREALKNLDVAADRSPVLAIPVHYGGGDGPDLLEVATLTGLSPDEVIARHCAGEYRVAMLGFAPGFPYLLGLDPALAVPRRTDPRQRVPAGSVAIGGSQTGIYPATLPGGWQLIGRTPLSLFDVHAEHPARLKAGDRVRFHAIDAAQFSELSGSRSP